MPDYKNILYFLLVVSVSMAIYLYSKIIKDRRGRTWSKFRKKDVQTVSKTMERKGFTRDTYTDRRYDSAYSRLAPSGRFVTAAELEKQFLAQDFSQEQVRHIVPEYLMKNVLTRVLRANEDGKLDAFEEFIYALGDVRLSQLWNAARAKLLKKDGKYWYAAIGRELASELRKRLSNTSRNLFSHGKNTNQFINSFIDSPDYLYRKNPKLLSNILSRFVMAMESVGMQPHLQMIEGEPLIGGLGSLAKFRFYSPRRPIDSMADPLRIMERTAAGTVWRHTHEFDRKAYRESMYWRKHERKHWTALYISIAVSLLIVFLVTR